MKPPLSGARRQQRLADLHRAVSSAVQGLHQHQLVVVTALRGEDVAMQQAVIEEHRSKVAKAALALETLGAFVERCRLAAIEDEPGAVAILRAG